MGRNPDMTWVTTVTLSREGGVTETRTVKNYWNDRTPIWPTNLMWFAGGVAFLAILKGLATLL